MINMPGILNDIAEIAGTEIAETVAAGLGGRRLAIGRKPRPDHPLRDYLNDRQMAELADRVMGDRVEIPNPTKAEQSRRSIDRSRHVRRMRAAGISTSEIAEILRLSRRWVVRLSQKLDG